MYGEFAGLGHADPRVHSNNMYLEIIVGAGILGALAFAWLSWRLLRHLASMLIGPALPAAATSGALAAAVLAIALHGLVDSFLTFTPTYILIAVVVGLVCSHRALDGADADRL